MSTKSPVKKNFKEKIIILYDAIFNGDDIAASYPDLWNEIFLLKVNVTYLEQLIAGKSGDALVKIKNNVNEFTSRCCTALKEEHQIKILNALQTLCAVMQSLFKKKFNNFGYDVIDILIGFDSANDVMQRLLESLGNVLQSDSSVSLKNLVLKLLLIMATATDNVSSNTLLEYFILNSVFDTLTQILADPSSRGEHGHEAILLLCILINYRKNEIQNPYLLKMSILDDELALNGLGLIISEILSTCNRKFALRRKKEEPSGSLLTSITSFVGSMFVSTESTGVSLSSENDGILLALYEAVLTNRNFFTVLGHIMSRDKDVSENTVSSHVIERTAPVPSNSTLEEETMDETQSGNLMATFLRFSSISIQDSKTENGADTSRLCFTILNCIVEDHYANAFLHDANMTFTVPIYKMNLYHRKVGLEIPNSKPLACVLLDLMVEFIVTHMMKMFPIALYRRCIGIIHRCLCYQKRCRIRLQYSWKHLWTALMNLLKFINTNESYLIPKYNIFELAVQIVNILNLFITYGDTFLPSPGSYDELYYEIIRVHQIFDNLYTLALRYISSDVIELKSSATKLSSCLVNVRAIIHHFTPKIDAWSTENGKTSLSEDEVLEVIRGNYETLTLKLMEGLDSYSKYSEHPTETPFFSQLIRKIIQRIRDCINIKDLQQLSVLKEFSTIS
eukprot:TCONS_00029172-protein